MGILIVLSKTECLTVIAEGRSAVQTYTEQPSVNVCERIFSFGEKRGEERNICQFGQVICLSALVLAT